MRGACRVVRSETSGRVVLPHATVDVTVDDPCDTPQNELLVPGVYDAGFVAGRDDERTRQTPPR